MRIPASRARILMPLVGGRPNNADTGSNLVPLTLEIGPQGLYPVEIGFIIDCPEGQAAKHCGTRSAFTE